MPYKIRHHRLFEKEIVKIPTHHQQKIYRILVKLKESPKKLPPNTTPLAKQKGVYRTRIGNLRLIYLINHKNKTISVLGVNPRGGVYKIINRLLH